MLCDICADRVLEVDPFPPSPQLLSTLSLFRVGPLCFETVESAMNANNESASAPTE